MGYDNSSDGCFTILALPLILAWYAVKFVLAVGTCLLVIPVRIIWLLITIPMTIFTGEDHTAGWEDSYFMETMWRLFFPKS